jgi:hypothetical protein
MEDTLLVGFVLLLAGMAFYYVRRYMHERKP